MPEKSVAQKLMIKEGRTVLLLNAPKNHKKLLGTMPKNVTVQESPSAPIDVIVAFVENRAQLEEQLPKLKPMLSANGMIWVAYHKGTSKVKTDINRDSINDYAHSIGLEGVAIISMDDNWSALRLNQTQ